MSKLEAGVYEIHDCEVIAANPGAYSREMLVEGLRESNLFIGTAHLAGEQACAGVVERFEPVRDTIGHAISMLDSGPGLFSRIKNHFIGY